jgi:hypothetical protein
MPNQSTTIAILTPREVEVIKQYVSLARRLRTSLGQMEEYWAGEAVPLNYEELTHVYGNSIGIIIRHITEHADKWPSIEEKLKELCENVLECFAQFKLLAEPAIYTIEHLPGYMNFTRTLEQEEADLRSCTIVDSELPQVFSVRSNVSEMIKSLKDLEPELSGLINSVQDFKENLMNGIETEINQFVKLDTLSELDKKLLKMPISDGSRALFSTFMGVIRGVVIEVIKRPSNEPLGDLEQLVISRLHPNHVREYTEALSDLTPAVRDQVEQLISQTKKGQVLFAQLESLHDWLDSFKEPLSNANKGVGQIRTLWVSTQSELESIESRVAQVKEHSTLHNIVKSLSSSLMRWKDTADNAQLLRDLLGRRY